MALAIITSSILYWAPEDSIDAFLLSLILTIFFSFITLTNVHDYFKNKNEHKRQHSKQKG